MVAGKLRRAPARHHTRPTRTPKSHARPPPGPPAVRHDSGQPPAKHACTGNGDGRRPLRPRIARGSRQPCGLSLVPAGMRRLRGRRPRQGKRACLAGVCPSQRAHSGRTAGGPAGVLHQCGQRGVRSGRGGASLVGAHYALPATMGLRSSGRRTRRRLCQPGGGHTRHSGLEIAPAERDDHPGAAADTAGPTPCQRIASTTPE